MPGYTVLLFDNGKLDSVTEDERSPWNLIIKRKGHINSCIGNYCSYNYISIHQATYPHWGTECCFVCSLLFD